MFVEDKALGETPVLLKEEAWRAILLKAAGQIEKLGWMQGGFGDEVHGVCMVGAINLAVTGTPYIYNLQSDNAIHHLSMRLGGEVAHWNDKVGRTREEVLWALRKAANS
jgi:hypothetical protein